MWKEWRETVWQRRLLNAQLLPLLILAVGAGLVGPLVLALATPLEKEGVIIITHVLVLTGMGMMGLLYAVGTSVDTIAGERERHTLETLIASPAPNAAIVIGKILAIVLVAFAVSVVMGSLSYINLVVLYGFDDTWLHLLLVLVGPLLSLFPALFVASVGFLISYRAKTVKGAQTVLGLLLFPVFMGLSFVFSVLPTLDQTPSPGAAVATAVIVGFLGLGGTVLAFVLAVTTFRRDRLLAP